MEGFGMLNGMFGKQDTKGVYRNNPQTGEMQRSWIQYEDGVFEPVRKDGSLRKKKDDHRRFQWWQVDKPADWKPMDDNAGFSWNHTVGSKDDLVDQNTGQPFKLKTGNLRMHSTEGGSSKQVPHPQPKPGMKTTLGRGPAALETRTDSAESAKPRNSAQDAAELRKQESKQRSSAEHARDLKELEKRQDTIGAASATSVGALGGMVQSKGQSKGGKASGNDSALENFAKEYKGGTQRRKDEMKREMKNEVKKLRKDAQQLKGKARNKLLKRAKQLEGALKIITDGKVRSGLPFILFNKQVMDKVLENPMIDPSTPDRT